jgi:eukaryotic-like serine/threonine-protein kinase
MTPAPVGAGVPAATERKSQTAAVALAIGVAVVAIGAVAWYIAQRPSAAPASTTQAQSAPAQSQPTSAMPTPATVAAAAPVAPAAPGTMLISAVGLIDPSDPRYRADKALLQSDLRADSKSQLVEKALGMMLDSNSLARNYDVLKTRLLSQSASFVPAVIKEGEPQLGKDGLM